MARGNQLLPIPPAEGLEHWIQVYWKLGFNDKLIASHVIDHFDKNLYGISAKTVSRRHTNLGLLGTRQRSKVFSLEELMPLYEEIRRRYPAMGGRGMVTQLRLHYDLKVSEKYLLDLFQVVEPEACWTFLSHIFYGLLSPALSSGGPQRIKTTRSLWKLPIGRQ